MKTQIIIRSELEQAATQHYRESEFSFYKLRMAIDPDARIGWDKNVIETDSFNWSAAWKITNAITDFLLQDGSPLHPGDITVKSLI